MAAVDQLLVRLKRLDDVVDYSSSNLALPQEVRDLALRGVAVQGLSAFEQFIRDRGNESASYLTNARIPASRLSGGTNAYTDRIVKTFPRRFQDSDDVGRRQLAADLSQTLASFSSGSLVGHDLFFAWSGSNIQAADVESMVSLFGIDKPWSELTAIWRRVDTRFPGNTSAVSVLKSFADLRHTMAHSVDAAIDPLAVRAVGRNVRLLSSLVDVCISEAISLICNGDGIPAKFGSGVEVRAVKRDGSRWPEYAPGATRAIRRHYNLESALTEATHRAARKTREVVVAYDGNEIIDWRTAI